MRYIPQIHNSYDKIGTGTMYPMWGQNQRIFYVHQTSMMVDHCTQHGQNPLIHLWYITRIQHLWKNGHKCYILVQSKGIFYMHQVPIMVDCCTKYEHQHFLFRNITTDMKNIAIITQIWHASQMLFYTSISKTWSPYLITVLNANWI